MMKQPDYDAWSDLLFRLQAITGPAELQGMLCGRLAGGQRLQQEEWLKAAIEFMDLVDSNPDTALDPESREKLTALYGQCLAGLSDANRPLVLLLPADELGLQPRTQALAGWCESFLHGVGASGLDGSRQLPAEVTEALRDIAKISQASLDETADGDEVEESEAHFVELVEYVRVAVLNLFLELNGAQPSTDKPDEPKQVH